MRKLLIVLMVVAMASFLFVGCMPDGVTPPVDEDEDEDVELPVSTTPVISEIDEGGVDLHSSKTQYVNGDILVEGFAPKYSTVQVYIDGIVVGTSTAYGGDEMFKVFISKTSLGVDGEKTIYATATEIGIKESDPSTKYKFTLDTVAPEIVSLAAEMEGLGISDEGTLTITFSEPIDEASIDCESQRALWSLKAINGVGEIVSGPEFIEDPVESDFDLVSSKVLEIKATLTIVVGPLIWVEYEFSDPADWLDSDDLIFIADLAGNKLLDFSNYCYLEVED